MHQQAIWKRLKMQQHPGIALLWSLLMQRNPYHPAISMATLQHLRFLCSPCFGGSTTHKNTYTARKTSGPTHMHTYTRLSIDICIAKQNYKLTLNANSTLPGKLRRRGIVSAQYRDPSSILDDWLFCCFCPFYPLY